MRFNTYLLYESSALQIYLLTSIIVDWSHLQCTVVYKDSAQLFACD